MTLYNGDCLEVMATLPSGSVDLTVTSPPYDNLRTYNDGLNDWTDVKWKAIISQLYRLTKDGGVVVWVVADATVNGSETGTSFRQALHAMECGFRLHDTMIWNKGTFTAVGALRTRYAPVFEYMFVFSKGAPRIFNPIKDRPNKTAGAPHHGPLRKADGTMKPLSNQGRAIAEFGQRFNIWEMPSVTSNTERTGHPAQFPLTLANDHILSWSNPGDVLLDPFMGSGTTGVAALAAGRHFIGIERDPGYFAIAQSRIAAVSRPSLVIDLAAVRAELALRPALAALQSRLRA